MLFSASALSGRPFGTTSARPAAAMTGQYNSLASDHGPMLMGHQGVILSASGWVPPGLGSVSEPDQQPVAVSLTATGRTPRK